MHDKVVATATQASSIADMMKTEMRVYSVSRVVALDVPTARWKVFVGVVLTSSSIDLEPKPFVFYLDRSSLDRISYRWE